MADNEFGGRITFDFDGLRIPPCEGDVVLDPTLFETEAKVNFDGSAAFTSKPKLPGADIKFRDAANIDWDAIMRKQGNITIAQSEPVNRTHLFTGAKLIGSPKVNTSTGEVDGLRVVGGIYRRI